MLIRGNMQRLACRVRLHVVQDAQARQGLLVERVGRALQETGEAAAAMPGAPPWPLMRSCLAPGPVVSSLPLPH